MAYETTAILAGLYNVEACALTIKNRRIHAATRHETEWLHQWRINDPGNYNVLYSLVAAADALRAGIKQYHKHRSGPVAGRQSAMYTWRRQPLNLYNYTTAQMHYLTSKLPVGSYGASMSEYCLCSLTPTYSQLVNGLLGSLSEDEQRAWLSMEFALEQTYMGADSFLNLVTANALHRT